MRSGEKFGMLTAVRKSPSKFRHSPRWLFLCDCGHESVCYTSKVISGEIKSCGCWRRESMRRRALKHGLSNNPFYHVWKNMLRRCEDRNCPAWPNYGGRGISVCERWISIENFIDDMGHRPEGYTLERKNNDGNYEPDNCIWATRTSQNRNRRPFKVRAAA